MATHLQFDRVVPVGESHARQQKDRVVELVVLQDDSPRGAVAEGPRVQGQARDAAVDGHLRLHLQLVRPVHLSALVAQHEDVGGLTHLAEDEDWLGGRPVAQFIDRHHSHEELTSPGNNTPTVS